MKNTAILMIAGFFLLVTAGDLAAYSRGICRGYGGGVHVRVYAGPRYHSRNDDLIILFMLSSTSTSIYCISIADEEEGWQSSGHRRYSLINYDRLKEEGARGRGEHLVALSYFLGCPADVGGDFAVSVQKNYRTLFTPSRDFQADRFMNRLKVMVLSDPILRSRCKAGSIDAGPL